MKRAMFIVAAAWMVGAGTASAIDQITTSTSEKTLFGSIVNMTSTVIGFKPQQNGGPTEIQANEVVRIHFENSPDGLSAAQRHILKAEYEDAIEALKKETWEDKRREVAEEILFSRALCTAQLALSGGADPEDASKKMLAFITNCPNSFHYLKACELMGDLCVALGKYADGQKFYGKLGQAPWPDYKIRAQVALGRSFLAQGNAAAADKAFDDALAIDAPGELAETQRTAARIGKARCLVLGGKPDVAIHKLEEIIDQGEEKNPEISAMAYNALGTALRKAGKPKEAILAFLHVHLLYYTQPDLDAEAAANLDKLFTETHKPTHARDMQQLLKEKYPNSRWAKGAK